jgi:hypothetical protein
MSKLPSFFNYEQEGTDQGNEIVQDLFISWTLRCSEEQIKPVNEKLYDFCRRFVYYLLKGIEELQLNDNNDYDINEDFIVEKVSTYRQWKRIDLLAEIKIKNIEKTFILNIENKVYTYPSSFQLENSYNAVKEYYNNGEIINNILLYSDDFFKSYVDKHQDIKNLCELYKYRLVTLWPEIFNFASKNIDRTDNYMFDEFWFSS